MMIESHLHVAFSHFHTEGDMSPNELKNIAEVLKTFGFVIVTSWEIHKFHQMKITTYL